MNFTIPIKLIATQNVNIDSGGSELTVYGSFTGYEVNA